MTTKEKIIEKALGLFNKSGTEPITTRHIASELKMSHGNLCYHYSKKEEIIKTLYQNLVGELDEEFKKMSTHEVNIKLLIDSASSTFSIQLKYKFLLIEMVKIIRTIPEIGEHYKQLYKQRQQQLEYILKKLIEKDLFRKEMLQGQYSKMIQQFYLIADFWISEAELVFSGSDDQKLKYYHELSLTFFLPYLSTKGLEEFRRYFKV